MGMLLGESVSCGEIVARFASAVIAEPLHESIALLPLYPRGRREVRAVLRAPGQGAVDHGDGVGDPVHRDERAEARAFFLAEQDLVEHVEPVERDAGAAVLALLHGIEERLAAVS